MAPLPALHRGRLRGGSFSFSRAGRFDGALMPLGPFCRRCPRRGRLANRFKRDLAASRSDDVEAAYHSVHRTVLNAERLAISASCNIGYMRKPCRLRAVGATAPLAVARVKISERKREGLPYAQVRQP